jgi:HAD superfamily hydrolase (TIGR01509 family)
MIKALIFDFDGLILDTESADYQSWSELYQEFGFQLPFEQFSQVIGTTGYSYDPLTELERLLGRPLPDRQQLSLRRQQRDHELVSGLPVLPGVEDTLQAAQRLGLKLAVASSSDRAWVTGHLERLELSHYFEAVKTSSDVTRAKPDPELYLEALFALGVMATEAIAFEDSPNGIKAARAAGLFCVAVPNPVTHRLGVNGADMHLASMAELDLIALVERLQ